MSQKTPAQETKEPGSTTRPEQSETRPCKDPWVEGFRFDDPYWDDAFDSWRTPTLRTCCRWC